MNDLTERDWRILSQCMNAVIAGPLLNGLSFNDMDVRALTGCCTDELQRIAAFWPNLNAPQLYREHSATLDAKFQSRLKLQSSSRIAKDAGQSESDIRLPDGPIRSRIFHAAYNLYYHSIPLDPPSGSSTFDLAMKMKHFAWDTCVGVEEQEVHGIWKKWRATYLLSSQPDTPLNQHLFDELVKSMRPPMPENDEQIIVQCLRMMVDGPFFKGLYYTEENVASAIGANRQQLRLLAQCWPEVNSPRLLAHYAQLEQLNADWYPPQSDEAPTMLLPTQAQVFSTIDCCLFYLTADLRFRQYPELYATAQEAWSCYVGVPFKDADAAIQRWRVRNRHAIVEAINMEEISPQG